MFETISAVLGVIVLIQAVVMFKIYKSAQKSVNTVVGEYNATMKWLANNLSEYGDIIQHPDNENVIAFKPRK